MGKDLTKVGKIVFMCSGYTCTKRGGEAHIQTLRNSIEAHALKEQVHTIKTLCTGQCENGPVMFLYPDGVWYKDVNKSRAESIISSHIIKGQLPDNILYKAGDAEMHLMEVPAAKTKNSL